METKVKVTYEVRLGGLDATKKKFNQLKELFENGKELDEMGHDKFNEAKEWLKPKPQICYKSNELCKYDCSGLCKESC